MVVHGGTCNVVGEGAEGARESNLWDTQTHPIRRAKTDSSPCIACSAGDPVTGPVRRSGKASAAGFRI